MTDVLEEEIELLREKSKKFLKSETLLLAGVSGALFSEGNELVYYLRALLLEKLSKHMKEQASKDLTAEDIEKLSEMSEAIKICSKSQVEEYKSNPDCEIIEQVDTRELMKNLRSGEEKDDTKRSMFG